MATPVYDFVFQPVWTRLFPNVIPERFLFPGNRELPFSDQSVVFWTLGIYLVLVHGGQWIMKNPRIPAFRLSGFFFIHNAILTAFSFLLLALITENIVPRLLKNGFMWSMCHADSYEADRRLELFYYLNYLTKFYEFLDTFFLVVRKKKVEFLHWFHHSMTMLLCYSQLIGRTSVSWVPITLNLFVHVIMYYYYARTSVSSKPIWWKKYLTTMQIVQFVIDLLVINFCMYVRTMSDWSPYIKEQYGIDVPLPTWGVFGSGFQPEPELDLKQPATCHGTYSAAFMGIVLINSYLLLFIEFFFKTYKKPKSDARKKNN